MENAIQPTLAEIWSKLYAIDCQESTKKKNGLTYLSWNAAWKLLMESYPQAHFEFEPIEVHADQSQTVHCVVVIGSHARRMWLPVMDYKNKSIPNPNAKDVSDSKMRCLVKCIAMFGLGFHIYQGQVQPEDTWNDDSADSTAPEEAVKAAPVAAKPEIPKKVAAKQKAPAPVVEDDEDEFYLAFDEAGATTWVERMIETIKTMIETKKGLRGIYDANLKCIDHIKNKFPEVYARLRVVMEEKQNAFKKLESKEVA